LEEKQPFNYGGLFEEFSGYKESEIVVLPIPYEKTSTWQTGSSEGPFALIEASMNMELYDIETGTEVYRKGIHTAKPVEANTPEEMVDETYAAAKQFLADNKFVAGLGGEHTVSIGLIKACSELFENISILQLDAHSDLRDSYEGSRYNHACVMARVKEFNPNIIQVGIRSMDSSEKEDIDEQKVFYAYKIAENKNWTEEVVNALNDNVFVNIDLDVFDSSVMPSTGTPEPGGLGWYDVTGLMKEIAMKKNIIGMDIVELCPTDNKAPDFTAAKLLYKILSYKYKFLSE